MTEAKTWNESLRCALTPLELAERADLAARKVQERDAIEAVRVAASKAAKAQIAELDEEIRALSTQVREKSEYRPVEVREIEHFENNSIGIYRTDTGELIRERAMTSEERQRSLFSVVKPAEEM